MLTTRIPVDQQSDLLLSVGAYSLQVPGDIALCRLMPQMALAPIARYSALALSPSVPRIGERVYAVGYPRFEVTEKWQTEHHCDVHFEAEMLMTQGTVTQIHVPRRDSLAPFPSFSIEADIPSGLSGGPVINEDGFVCGLVSLSRSWEPTATCSLIALALALPVPSQDDGCIVANPIRRLYDLVKGGEVASDSAVDNVALHVSGDEVEVVLVDCTAN